MSVTHQPTEPVPRSNPRKYSCLFTEMIPPFVDKSRLRLPCRTFSVLHRIRSLLYNKFTLFSNLFSNRSEISKKLFELESIPRRLVLYSPCTNYSIIKKQMQDFLFLIMISLTFVFPPLYNQFIQVYTISSNKILSKSLLSGSTADAVKRVVISESILQLFYFREMFYLFHNIFSP